METNTITNGKLKYAPLGIALITLVNMLISVVFGKLLGMISSTILQTSSNSMGMVAVSSILVWVINLITFVVSIVFCAIVFFIIAMLYLAVFEKVKVRIGATIGISIGVVVVGGIISFLMSFAFSMIASAIGVVEIMNVVNVLSYVIKFVEYLVGALIVVYIHKPKNA